MLDGVRRAARCRVEWKPVLTDSGAIHRLVLAANADPDCIGLIAWMHTFSPAKMWIAGPRRAADAAAAPAHAGERLAAVVRDRHGLHEPEPGRPRRPGVRLHPDPARRAPQDRRRPRQQPRRACAGSPTGSGRRSASPRSARSSWPGSATTCATSPSPRATRSRPSATFGVSVNAYGVNALVAAVDAASDAEVDAARRGVRRRVRDRARAAARRRPARVAALRRADRGRAAGVPRGRRVRRVHHELRGPRRAAPAARPGRAAADGRGLRLRRRGRLEDLGHAPHDQGDGRRAARRAPRSWRTTRTTSARDRRRSSARTCSRSARASPPAKPRIEIHPLGIGDREDPVRLVFDAAPGPAVVVGICDLGDRFRLVLNEIDVTAPDEPLPKLPVARAVWEPKPGPADVGRVLDRRRRPAPQRAVQRGRHRRARRLRRGARASSSLVIDGDTRPRRFTQELRWNNAYHRLAAGF